MEYEWLVDANATPQVVTQEQIRQFCDPSSTHMKFVNADESKICNVPESTPATPNNVTGVTTHLQGSYQSKIFEEYS